MAAQIAGQAPKGSRLVIDQGDDGAEPCVDLGPGLLERLEQPKAGSDRRAAWLPSAHECDVRREEAHIDTQQSRELASELDQTSGRRAAAPGADHHAEILLQEDTSAGQRRLDQITSPWHKGVRAR